MIEISLGGAASEPTLAEQLLQVLGALSPFAVVLGVWLGKRWEQGGATEAWRREQRLTTYSGFIEALYKVRDQVTRAEARETSAAYLEEVNVILDASLPMEHLASAIRILGPNDAWEAAKEALDAFREVTTGVMELGSPPRSTNLDRSLIARAVDAEQAFLDAAQRAIG
jgi:hypothetical protein